MKNNYLLVDIGNTNIKFGIYNCSKNKLEHIMSIKRNKSHTLLSKEILLFKSYKPRKAFISSTRSKAETNKISLLISKLFGCKVKLINYKDFNKLINVPNVSNVAVDLLLLMFWAAQNYKKSAIICLGTVYSVVFVENKKCRSVLLIPSVSKAIDEIPQHSCIPSSMLPSTYNKVVGLNTKDCFAAGANLMLEGLVNNIAKTYGIDTNNIIITGGDSFMYQNLNKKYSVIDELTIKALALLVKEKCW